MQSKTFEKLLRKFETLPLHFIDTDVLFEANNETKLGNQCSDYLNRVGYKYRGIIPLSVMGEFFMITFRDIKEDERRQPLFNFIETLIKRRKINFSTLHYKSFKIVDKIKEFDTRVEDMDAMHLANCIQDKGAAFVTFDGKLMRNAVLENEFGIRISHPKDL